MSLIDLEPSEVAPVHSSDMTSFGNAAVDIDLLEKEIAAKDEANRQRDQLSGSIGQSGSGSSAPPVPAAPPVVQSLSGGGRRMQEVDLDAELDTLDEPVWDTIKRDLLTVSSKFGHVIFPMSTDRQQLLKDWDLWGPLFICVALSLLLNHSSGGSSGAVDSSPQFTQVFSLTFFGSVVVTMNIKLLGGQISFFQSICVIGYCLLPPAVAALICSTLLHDKLFVVRLLLTAIGFCWATFAAMGFLAGSQPEKRRLLVLYPIFLFYFIVSWMILSHS